jgi:hypothetical protein
MGYPWYSERKGNAGKNGQFKISLEKNCETKEIRFVATLIDSSKRTGKKSMSSLDITDLYNKVESYLTKMESQQNGLLEDITEIFNVYGLTIQTEETPEQIEEVTTSPEIHIYEEVTAGTPEEVWEAMKEGKKVLMSCNDLDAFDNYAKTFDIPDYNLYRMINVNSFDERIEDYNQKRCTLNIKNYLNEINIYKKDKERMARIQSEINKESNVIDETVKTSNENKQPSYKVNKETETIIIRGYMGKVETEEGKRIELDDFDLYLVKHNKYWSIYEKNTGKSLVSYKSTKKEVIDTLTDVLNNHYDKFKDAITSTIEKDGYITDYKIGSWIRSA